MKIGMAKPSRIPIGLVRRISHIQGDGGFRRRKRLNGLKDIQPSIAWERLFDRIGEVNCSRRRNCSGKLGQMVASGAIKFLLRRLWRTYCCEAAKPDCILFVPCDVYCSDLKRKSYGNTNENRLRPRTSRTIPERIGAHEELREKISPCASACACGCAGGEPQRTCQSASEGDQRAR